MTNYRGIIILIGILLLALGTWYLYVNRQIKNPPQRANLVYNLPLLEGFEVSHE
mgnify:FL=1